MSPSPKRRKLDHSNDEEQKANSFSESDGGDSDSQFSSEVAEEEGILPNGASASKPPHPVQNNTQHHDESALYSGGTYKSNMFKLQVDEMLGEVRPSYKRMSWVEDALHNLNNVIGTIEEREALPVLEASKSLLKSHKITVPYPDPQPHKDLAYKLAYAKPSKINVVGSYALKTMVKSEDKTSVDMVVIMPESIFQEKDFLNYRYFYKRSYYLACIAAGLHDSASDEFDLRFEYLNGNDLQPFLVATPKSSKHSSMLEIHIIPAAPTSLFPEPKLRPSKNSIRPASAGATKSAPAAPTPFYNASLKADCNYESFLKLLHLASKQSDGFKDACILGRIWLRQRGFGSSIHRGGFGHFEWAALTALLLRGGGPKGHSILSEGYSSYQLFRAVVQFLATTDLVSKPHVHELPEFVALKSDSPMFYDGSRGQNVLYKMTPWSYALLREEARTSIEMLNDAAFDQFESTFIIRTAVPLQRYDCLVRIPVPEVFAKSEDFDHKTKINHFSTQIFQVLREGFGDRLKLLDIKTSELPPWSIKSSGPKSGAEQVLSVAVVFDTANIGRIVDHGPSAEEKKKAFKFQKFWGEKAELRRFRDGRILESLIWSPGSDYSIFQEILSYLVRLHFNPEISQGLVFTGGGFEKLLPGSTSSSKAFESLRQSFNAFENDVRSLESLPLQLRQLSAIDPQLRFSSLSVPLFDPRKPLQKPADVLIQFEGSGRWPDDLIAIQRTKIAFLLKIGSLLQDANDTTTTRLGLENEMYCFKNSAFLDVIYQSGAVFRLRIHIDREQTLLQRLVKEKNTDHLTREDAVLALSTYKQTFSQLPLHAQSIATHCTRFTLLSPTIRLMKMWFDRHVLSRHVSAELIELLVAHVFLHPFPWQVPSSAMTGFLRTLLFISRWDWRTAPLIVDFNGSMTSQEVSSIKTRLEAWRKIDPAMSRTVIFAASNHDTTGIAFTDRGPSKMVAARMTALARAASKVVRDQGLDMDPKALFMSSTSDYDFVIHLSHKFVDQPGEKRSNKQKFKNLEVQSDLDLENIGYQPVRLFLGELENHYSNSVVFFHRAAAGSVIAGLWNPQYVQPRAFKVNLPYATKPTAEEKEEGAIKLDKNAILSGIARLGGDLISNIEVNG